MAGALVFSFSFEGFGPITWRQKISKTANSQWMCTTIWGISVFYHNMWNVLALFTFDRVTRYFDLKMSILNSEKMETKQSKCNKMGKCIMNLQYGEVWFSFWVMLPHFVAYCLLIVCIKWGSDLNYCKMGKHEKVEATQFPILWVFDSV